ncbi:C-terminal processing protease CtpA/Prc, contains a PDZ domain [Arsukibacterium tuosuense]|uniref:C-terminal processing protease CtpA/Prc, contains a PDZ domain n=1 Tax=Arsukibacterium tuosuense TaxID=1323745 RepID=A0A285JIP3_9GAMM|nr:S41 family peptidase [Arsukibacterium tuosuense]SNY59667.1 C-terminal processing protease CtpA/Prc, contains a PDZ domain [Arsukibacterium tuosuense]
MESNNKNNILKPYFLFFMVGLLVLALIDLPPQLAAASPDKQHGNSAENVADISKTDSQQLENLRAFAKLYGYVRYFHPSDEAAAIDWERFAVYGVSQVLKAQNRDELQQQLTELFAAIAPTVQIYPQGSNPPAPEASIQPEDITGLELVAWQHQGVGLGNSNMPFYQSARLNRLNDISPAATVATTVQFVDATAYRGMEIKLVAALKAEGGKANNNAHLLLRVDRPNNQFGAMNYMADRPVTSAQWQSAQINGYVDKDAEKILIGAMLMGQGKAWFGSFQLYARADSEEEWKVVPLTNPLFTGGEVGDPPAGWYVNGKGFQFSTTTVDAFKQGRSLLIASGGVEQLFNAKPAAGELAERALGAGLIARVPLALYSKDGKTLKPANTPELSHLEQAMQSVQLAELTATDSNLRFASVLIAWNIFQHFYPYFDLVDTDWQQALTDALRQAQTDSSEHEFLTTLQRMMVELQDGHGGVGHALQQGRAWFPFSFAKVEGKVVIKAIVETEKAAVCVEQGDILLALDGTNITEAFNEQLDLISGSRQWRTHQALLRLGIAKHGTEAILLLERQGRQLTCNVLRNYLQPVPDQRPAAIESLDDSIYYVDLTRAAMTDIQPKIDELASAEGVIFDLRGYPKGDVHAILQHLSTKPMQSAYFRIPQHIYPDQERMVGYNSTGRWQLSPLQPHFQGKFVFLTDSSAISNTETLLEIVKHYQLAEIVGKPTAGANGNINPFSLPGGYRVNWTGMRVVQQDQSALHLVGIQPTVTVEQTLQGVLVGRDEYLERAIELLK